MSGIKPPDDSLNSYFDELLGDEVAFSVQVNSVPSPVAIATSVAAKVVTLPKKAAAKVVEEKYGSGAKSTYHSPEPKPRTARKTYAELQTFAEPERTQTLEQKQKLEKLLQTARPQLLLNTTVDVKIDQPVITETAPQVTTAFQAIPDEIQEWDIETAYVAPLVIEPVLPPEGDTVTTAMPYQLEGVEWLENGLPQWAQARFDVLLFQVSGLTLAVPLIALGQIRPITEELTPLFGQADWFMGFHITAAGKISTVNTAKFVMPERYDENFPRTAKYVVSINGVPWGLAVDSVNQPISLQPEDVKWRTDRSRRPWLAGTVKDHMCALLDIPRIGQMLIDADKNFVPQRA